MGNKNKQKSKQQIINQILGKGPVMLSGSGPTKQVPPDQKIKILAWGATPYVITGFGVVMKEILQNLYRSHPGTYEIYQCAINFHGDFCDEFQITGGPQNGRYMQWPAAVQLQGGMNLYGQQKFLEMVRGLDVDWDLIFLFEDPFWVGGPVPGSNPPVPFIDAIRHELAQKGRAHVPIVGYFPIDGVPKPQWIHNLSKLDIPITYLPFGANECLKINPQLNQRIGVIPHGVNTKEFFPISKEECRTFKRAMFGDKFADSYMFLNVNRNQLRKMVPSSLIAFKQFQKVVPNSFIFLNMKAVDVGWNLIETCNALGLQVGKDVMFPPDFNVQKGLSIEDLNRVFNCADVLVSSAIGGGWELSVTQAFATKTAVLAPANTSHIDLLGPQDDVELKRGQLYGSGQNLSQIMIFPNDNEVPRPLPDVDDMVQKMVWMYQNPEACRKMEQVAYDWAVKDLSWEKVIVPQFHNAFSIAKNVKKEREKVLQQRQAEALKQQQAQQAAATVSPVVAPTAEPVKVAEGISVASVEFTE